MKKNKKTHEIKLGRPAVVVGFVKAPRGFISSTEKQALLINVRAYVHNRSTLHVIYCFVQTTSQVGIFRCPRVSSLEYCNVINSR